VKLLLSFQTYLPTFEQDLLGFPCDFVQFSIPFSLNRSSIFHYLQYYKTVCRKAFLYIISHEFILQSFVTPSVYLSHIFRKKKNDAYTVRLHCKKNYTILHERFRNILLPQNTSDFVTYVSCYNTNISSTIYINIACTDPATRYFHVKLLDDSL
jgi:hypothetical protein